MIEAYCQRKRIPTSACGLLGMTGPPLAFPTGEGAAAPRQNPKFLIIFANSSLAAKVA